MKVYALPEETYQNLLKFLETLPLNQVKDIYNDITRNVKLGTYTDTPPPKAEEVPAPAAEVPAAEVTEPAQA